MTLTCDGIKVDYNAVFNSGWQGITKCKKCETLTPKLAKYNPCNSLNKDMGREDKHCIGCRELHLFFLMPRWKNFQEFRTQASHRYQETLRVLGFDFQTVTGPLGTKGFCHEAKCFLNGLVLSHVSIHNKKEDAASTLAFLQSLLLLRHKRANVHIKTHIPLANRKVYRQADLVSMKSGEIMADFAANPDYWVMELSSDASNGLVPGWQEELSVLAAQHNLLVHKGKGFYCMKTNCAQHNVRFQVPCDGKPGTIFVHGTHVVVSKERVSFFNRSRGGLQYYVQFIFEKLKFIEVIDFYHAENEVIMDLRLVKDDGFCVHDEDIGVVYVARNQSINPRDGVNRLNAEQIAWQVNKRSLYPKEMGPYPKEKGPYYPEETPLPKEKGPYSGRPVHNKR
eukprot:sb/3479636/